MSEETITTNEATGGKKGVKPERFDLLPSRALGHIARHYGKGAEKYEAHNWRKGYEWGKSFAALQRHLWAFWDGEDVDAETGSYHLAAAGFHVLSLLTFMEEHPELDDRPSTPERFTPSEDDLQMLEDFLQDRDDAAYWARVIGWAQ